MSPQWLMMGKFFAKRGAGYQQKDVAEKKTGLLWGGHTTAAGVHFDKSGSPYMPGDVRVVGSRPG